MSLKKKFNMKKIVILSFFLSNLAIGQITKRLGDFSKVTGFDQIEVHLVPSNENKITLDGTNSDQVELVTKDDELKIRMPFGKLLKGDDVVATVYFKNLEAVEANEGSNVIGYETLKSNVFDIIAKEGGKVKVAIESSKISVKASSGAVVNLSGDTSNVDAVVTTGASLEATECKTNQATLTVNAGGEIYITASDFVDAKTRAGGNIFIYGNPKQVNQKTVLGGSIVVK